VFVQRRLPRASEAAVPARRVPDSPGS
jgi:hypothetical protein